MAGAKSSPATQRLNAAMVQSAVYGQGIPFGWGTFRVSPNLIYLENLTSKTDKSASGGKGGSSAKTYDYWADVLLAICEGGTEGIVATYEVFKDSSHFVDGSLWVRYGDIATALTAAGNTTMAADYSTMSSLCEAINIDGSKTALWLAGLSLQPGAMAQAPLSWLTGAYAIGYSQTAFLYAQQYPLSTSATLSNHTVTVSSQYRYVLDGVTLDDCEPSVCFTDALTNEYYGVPSWPAGVTGDYTEWQTSNIANNFFISPVWDSQTSAASGLQEMLDASNAAAFWSEGLLKVRPYSDTAVTNNGVTFTPNLTPIYSLTDEDYQGDAKTDPVECIIKAPEEAYNKVQVSFDDRTHQYNSQTIPANDPAAIDQYGLRVEDPVSYRCIKMPSVATAIAQIRVQRTANIWQTFKFKVGPEFALLEPMDLLEITDSVLGLNAKLVRITEINEDSKDDTIEITAEEMLVGTSHAPLIVRQVPAGVITNYDVAPGSVESAVLINPSRQLTTGGDMELWIAASGGPNWGGCDVYVSLDGTNYSEQPVGRITGASTFGTLTGPLVAGSDPDTTNTLEVSLAESEGSLASVSHTAADADALIAYVGSELISYATATLTGANAYNVTYLRRGLYGTTNEAHLTGEQFVLLDDTIFKYAYSQGQVGSTLYVKFVSFNIFIRALENISAVTAYTVTLNPSAPTEQTLIDSLDNTISTVTALQTQLDASNAAQQTQNYLGDGTSTQQLALTASNTATTVQSQVAQIATPAAGGTAMIINTSTLYVDSTTSWATYQATISSTFSGHTSSISTLETAVAGLSANVSILANSNGQAVGFSFGTTGTSNFFDIVTSKFRVVDASSGGASPLVPFQIGTVGGVASIGLNGAVMIDGSLTINAIPVNELQTVVELSLSSPVTGTGSYSTVVTTSITLLTAGLITIQGSAGQSMTSGTRNWGFKPYINGVAVSPRQGTAYADAPGISASAKLPAGTYNVHIDWMGQDSTATLTNLDVAVTAINNIS